MGFLRSVPPSPPLHPRAPVELKKRERVTHRLKASQHGHYSTFPGVSFPHLGRLEPPAAKWLPPLRPALTPSAALYEAFK